MIIQHIKVGHALFEECFGTDLSLEPNFEEWYKQSVTTLERWGAEYVHWFLESGGVGYPQLRVGNEHLSQRVIAMVRRLQAYITPEEIRERDQAHGPLVMQSKTTDGVYYSIEPSRMLNDTFLGSIKDNH